MARARKPAGIRSRNNTFNTKWLKNAAKSVGLGYSEALKTISPNLYETASIGVEATSKVISTLRTGRAGQERLNNTLKSNKYVRAMQTAYKNAISDIKSGNLAGSDHSGSFDDNSSDSGFSYGEEVGSTEKSSPMGNAVLSINTQVQNAAMANMKMQKASMDATISLTSASMQQSATIGTEVINQLTNINSSLQALVQYNNENMNRLIEASIGFYEKTGAAIDKKDDEKDKIRVDDLLTDKGGINMGQYKKYVKHQFKSMVNDSQFGAIASMVTSDAFIDMVASNPLGAMTQALSSYMIPKMIQTSIKGMEEAYNNFLPTLLTEIADASESEAPGFAGKLRKMIGDTFGIKVKQQHSFSDAQVNRGAIPFDGETKHAITEIITKELRDQTGYLKVLAEKVVGPDYQKKADAEKEYWSYSTNSYMKKDEITTNIAESISKAITSSIESTAFGSEFSRAKDAAGDDKAKAAAIDQAISEVYFQMSRSKQPVSEEMINRLIKNCQSDKTVKTILMDHFKAMKENSTQAYNGMRVAQLQGITASNDAYREIDKDQTGYNVNRSVYNRRYEKDQYNKHGELIHRKGDKLDADKVTYDTLFKGKNKAQVTNPDHIIYNNGAAEDVKGFIGTITKSMNNFVSGVLNGKTGVQIIADASSVIDKQAETIGGSIKNYLFGSEDENGNKEGGVFSGMNNYLKDTVSSFKHFMVGGEYTDRKGVTHQDDGNSVLDNMKNIGSVVKEGVMEKLFGKTKGEDGKYEKTKEGLFGSIKDTFTQGFNGWLNAFFGTEGDSPEDAEKKRKETMAKFKDYAKENLPKGVAGGVVGAIGGGMMGSSLLGIILGGPMFGAAAGAAAGFLAKSKTFQKILFGEEDENGERTGGIISKKAQDFMKKNKNMLVGSAATGLVTGGITGGGILGMVVGGPIAGSLMGMATGIVLKSDKFQSALFGEMGEDGKRHGGAFKNIAEAFNKHFQGEKKPGDRKKAGMGALGAAGGALTAAVIGKMGLLGAMLTPAGPIGGALVGLGLGIKAAGGNFKEWLFGKKGGLENLNGKKSDKQGVIGQIGNTINANFIKPIKTQSVIFIKQLGFTMEHDIVRPLSIAGEAIADQAGKVMSGVKESVSGAVKGLTGTVKDVLFGKEDKHGNREGGVLSPAINMVSGAMNAAATAIRKTTIGLISIPGRILRTGMALVSNKIATGFEFITRPVRRLFKDVRSVIFSGIKGVFKLAFKGVSGIFRVASAPFRFTFGLAKAAGRSVKRKVGTISRKILGARADRIRDAWAESGKTGGNIFTRMRQNRIVAKADRTKDLERLNKEIANMKLHDKNAKFINKYTNGQFSEDTDEARQYLMKVNPNKYLDLIKGKPLGRGWKGENLSVDQENERARIAKEGEDAPQTEEQLNRADPNKLNWRGKVLYYIKGIFGDTSNLAKDSESGHNMTRHEKKENKKKDELQRKIKMLEREGFDVGITDDDTEEEKIRKVNDAFKRRKEKYKAKHNTSYENEYEVDSEIGNRPDDGPGVRQYLKDSLGQLGRYIFGAKDADGNRPDNKSNGNILQRMVNPLGEFGRDITGGLKRTWVAERLSAGAQNVRNHEEALNNEGGNGTRIIYHKPMGGRGILSTIGKAAAGLASKASGKATDSMFSGNSSSSDEMNADNKDEKKDSLFSKLTSGIGSAISSLTEKFSKKSNDSDDDNISDEDEANERRDDENRRARSRRSRRSGSRAKGRNASADATFATQEGVSDEHTDKASDMAQIATANAKTAKQLQAERKAEKAQEEQTKYSKLGALASTAGAKASSGIHSMLSKIFSKDGLKIAGVAALLAGLNKYLPGILDAIGGIAQKNADEAKWTEEHNARTNGGSAADEAKRIVKKGATGNIFQFNEDGSASSLTTPTAKYLGRLGFDLFSKNAKQDAGKFSSKIVQRRAKFNKIFQDVRGNSQNLLQKFKTGKQTQKNFNDIFSAFVEQGYSEEEALELAKTGVGEKEAAKLEKGLGKHLKKNKILDGAKSLGNQVKNKVTGSKIGQLASKGKTTIKSAVTKTKNAVKGLGTKMKGEVETLVKKSGEKLGTTKAGGAVKKMAAKLKDMVSGFIEKVMTKFGKKAGEEAVKNASQIGPIKKLIIKGIDKTIGKLFPKASALLSSKVAAASVSFGLSEAVFTIGGAIDGATGAAKLFHVNKKDVDYKMIIISTILGAFNGTTVGSVVDLVFSTIDAVVGTELYNSIATVLYNAWSGGQNSKGAKKLKASQNKFKEDYLKYQTKELKEQYETQKKAGIIDSKVTLDQFIAGVQDGTYNADYKSEEDYNTSKNASIGDKAMSVVGKAGKGIKNLWSKTFGKKKSYEKDGTTYEQASDGKWHAYQNGEDIGVISEKSIPKDAKETSKKGVVRKLIDKPIKAVGKAAKSVGNAVLHPIKTIKTAGNAIGKAISKPINALKNVFKNVGKPILGYITGSTKSIKFDIPEDNPGTPLVNTIAKVTEFEFAPINLMTRIGRWGAKKIGGFVGGIADIGSSITKQAGQFLDGKADDIVVKVKKDNPLGNMANVISGVTKFVLSVFRPFKQIFDWLSDKISNTVDSVGDKIKNSAVGKAANAVKNGAKNAAKAVKGAWSWMTGGGNGYGGRGESEEYFSQNDPRWRNKKYGNDGAKMGDSGCGPAAMAMAVNTAIDRGGRGVNPMQMAGLAQATGNRDETGTNWRFMSEAPAMMGMSSKQALSPSADYINHEIDSGRPVILSGKSGGYGGKSVYTNAGHYVVATGRDNNGNLIIKDPRGASYSGKFNADQVASETGSAWTIGGYGKKTKDKANKKSDASKQKKDQKSGKDWLSIVAACKKSIGQQQKGYSQSGYIDVTVDGKTINTRRDCSGFVSVCLSFYTGKKLLTNSSGYESDPGVAKYLTSAGFSKMPWPGFDKTQAGDIYVKGGSHVEICAEGGTKKVYNCGSNESCNNPGVTNSGHSGYNYIWRPGDPGTGGQDLTVGAASGSSDSSATADTSSTTSIFDSLSSAFTNVFTEAGNRLLKGDKNTDFTSVANAAISSDTGSSSSSGTDDSASITGNISLNGNDNVEKVWNFFTGKGFSPAATAGILGNMYQESGVNPKSIQGNGKGPAAGIFQWENYNTKSSRFGNLYKRAKKAGKSWDDLGVQLSYALDEMKSQDISNRMSGKYGVIHKDGTNVTDIDGRSYVIKPVDGLSGYKKMTDEAEAVKTFEGAFERAGKPNFKRRIEYAKSVMKKYGNSGGKGGFGDGPSISNRRFTDTYDYGLGEEDYGGFGKKKKKSSKRSTQAVNIVTNTQSGFYRNTTKKSSANELLYNMITILSHIAANTQRADNKLGDIKKYTKSSITNKSKKNKNSEDEVMTQNNYYVVKDGTPQLQKTETTAAKPSRADTVAFQIATGGY